jgi:hypothetical protein
MSVTASRIRRGVEHGSVPTTLSAMTATMLSDIRPLPIDWRGVGVKMVPVRVRGDVQPPAPQVRECSRSSEPAGIVLTGSAQS